MQATTQQSEQVTGHQPLVTAIGAPSRGHQPLGRAIGARGIPADLPEDLCPLRHLHGHADVETARVQQILLGQIGETDPVLAVHRSESLHGGVAESRNRFRLYAARPHRPMGYRQNAAGPNAFTQAPSDSAVTSTPSR